MTSQSVGHEPRCSDCHHRQSRFICGCHASSFYNQTVQPENSCEHFSYNPGQDYMADGLKFSLADEPGLAVVKFRQALEHPLPEDDQLAALSLLSDAYVDLITAKGPIDGAVNSEEFRFALEHMAAAGRLDSKANLGYFGDPVNRARLSRFDVLVSFMGDNIQDKEGVEAAVRFLEEKIAIFDYLPTNPLISSLLAAGCLYVDQKKPELAAACFRRVLQADVVNPVDETSFQEKARSRARENLRIIAEHGARPQCFIATAALGSPLCAEIELLRSYRDKILSRSFAGRAFIWIYSKSGPHLAWVVHKCTLAQTAATWLLVKPLLTFARAQLQGAERGESDGKDQSEVSSGS